MSASSLPMKPTVFLFAVLAMTCGCRSLTGLDASKMKVSQSSFGSTKAGQPVDLYTLTNARGNLVSITNYGGTITRVVVPDKAGQPGDVVLGFDTLREYEEKSPFFGCITGRYANRIANGKFTLDGQTYSLAVNNGPNHLHGGKVGFDKAVWSARPFQSRDSVGVELTHTSPDGDEGYPGALSSRVTYTWDNDNRLRIDYAAATTRPTVVNLTNHSYFNLAGHKSGDILGHLLTIHADTFTPTDPTAIPTGELRAVTGTPFDFTSPHAVGERINAPDQQIKLGGGYDHNFVVNGRPGRLRPCAEVYEPKSGRIMVVETTEPGVQLYTANFLNGLKGKDGSDYNKRDALCLETQHYPDSPNKPDFPSTVLRPGRIVREHHDTPFRSSLMRLRGAIRRAPRFPFAIAHTVRSLSCVFRRSGAAGGNPRHPQSGCAEHTRRRPYRTHPIALPATSLV